MYGSNSAHTCFGQFLQDFRFLTDWGNLGIDWGFRAPIDLQRPAPYNAIEKNWFPFWDRQGHIYIHHDIFPQRVFSKLSLDGSGGPDLAALAQPADQTCMERYFPKVGKTLESIHQATNSLLVTMCNRNDSSCQDNATNTFIMTLFQHKTFYSYHSVYEPYVILFSQDAPFAIHAISKRPLWINGRGTAGEKRPKYLPLSTSDPWNQTEMMYVTSISWMSSSQTYHGYQDDILFVSFGIEDERSGGIDILARDVLEDIGLCNTD
ncbi:hypothetical protein RBB50_004345 [Rhinocladiella similis]